MVAVVYVNVLEQQRIQMTDTYSTTRQRHAHLF
jgi:hypothetical protein